ncbi:ParB N-terminal domain-containing protein [Desulforhopalus sp. IMCC35007]|uniref:Lrp/AsnC ligand binding domain-containing protein n=1 Tax=Desulforhopalus sp. IMCC35007 TaxID=2569543 RepID=UPI0010AE875E|nr:ParB N-terminal domain-containing protein [Desulforhopalus sp. IMCC35007]TKB11699.1 transcriptional regulator [Desulforhopalus sp. IMCC35007]
MATIFSKFKPLEALKKLVTGEKEEKEENVRSFNARQETEKAYEAVERGTLMVPLDKIVGSVGRYHDFDNQFRTQHKSKDERLQGILKAMREGKNLPPIALYQIKEDFFILDGHHRFKAARELGHTHIRSRIVELLPSKNTFENNLYNEKIQFRDKAGLKNSLEITEPGQFSHLEWQIEEHQRYLSTLKKQVVTFKEAALDWYNSIYRPLFTLIDNSQLVHSFPRRTVDDLYLYISVHQWEKGKKRKYGIDIDKLIPTDMEAFRSKMAEHQDQEYPEMKREIIVFVLLNIEGKYEMQIIEKLLALDEVQEVHAIHGSIDILTKIILKRDLLSSDAELISQFIQSTIRQWKGVVSSQTLIPGISRVKGDDRCHL